MSIVPPFPMLLEKTHPQIRTKGFALVVTLSLMILLTVIAVGLLSLSAIALRSTGQEEAQAQARANARLALMMAIGELQKHAGPDTRITAPSDIVDETSPPLLGVWKSWEGTDHETSGDFAGRPIAPDYAGAKTKAAADGGRFLAWLVSGAGNTASALNPAALASKTPTGSSVPLLSSGSLAEGDERRVHIVPQALDAGSYAWWVSGENQKARLPRPYQPENANSVAAWSGISKSHAVADPKPFGLNALLANPAPAEKAITLQSANLLTPGPDRPGESFHDLTARSVGLLTNTATGGWRKDLSLLTENWDAQPKSGLPFFRLSPDKNAVASIPTEENSYPQGAILYPWAAYRGGSWPIHRQGAVSSWANLKDFATHYQRISTSAGGSITTPIHYRHINSSSHYDYTHRVRVLPVTARIQWIFSHSAKKQPDPSQLYEPRLLLTPVITMWNPYNVEIASPPTLQLQIGRAMPAALKYTINGIENPKYHSVMAGDNNKPSLGGSVYRYRIDEPFTLMPGETRVFSPTSPIPVSASTIEVTVSPGYRTGGGHSFPVRGPNDLPMAVPGSASIKVAAKFDTSYDDFGARGVGVYFDLQYPHTTNTNGSRFLAYRMTVTPEMAREVYLEIPANDLAGATSVSDVSETGGSPLPFLSTVFGARTASKTNLAAKGYLQSSPLVNFTTMGNKDVRDIGRHYSGTGHPVNSPFDYSFVKHTGAGDSFTPDVDARNRGSIVTGFTQANGLSRCVIAELPVRPLVSLAELTHWDARFENPIPPYALNIIANSDATPLLPSDKVVNVNDKDLKANLQYDDSYCANHLLFDDWFFSSITPQPAIFGSPARSQQETYAGFVKGKTPLANRAYRPILEDAAAEDTDTLFEKHIAPVDSWKTIASRLEVEGMFNVNSTSVTAWRALLGHARGQRVPHIRESGGGWNVGLSDETDHVWNRFSIAADTAAGTPGSSGAFPGATDFSGYRTVDGDFLDKLAEDVVAQIRARGPFLSLSEFVNRQLSSGDLALAGTIQAALNKLSEYSSTDPFKILKDPEFSSVSVADPPSPAGVAYDEEYKFREAAVGHSSYGLPGWTRQADILRPLAPILSARDDTFTIRTYGDARDANGKVLAKAWCEATVRRSRDFADPADAPDITTAPTSPANIIFGRRVEIISFRWLSFNEV